MAVRTIAFVYGAPIGVGGLGAQAGNALRALALTGSRIHAIGPGPGSAGAHHPNVTWHVSPTSPAPLLLWTPLRRHVGLSQLWTDRRVGRFAASIAARVKADLCYAFTQVGLETVRWAKAAGVPTVIESPNGHIRAFRSVYVTEAADLCRTKYVGHPTLGMVERVEEELALADRVRVSSAWAKESLSSGGVPSGRIASLQQGVDLDRFRPAAWPEADGPLRVCFVGSLDLRKGFVYLLRAVGRLGQHVPVHLHLVGATGDRCCRGLLERERSGLDVVAAPGDPVAVLAQSEVFALPTLEDGSPFAAAEAMASGRPVITTTSTGAAEWVQAGETGWVVPPRSVDGLSDALMAAHAARSRLREMGELARTSTERRAGPHCDDALARWILER